MCTGSQGPAEIGTLMRREFQNPVIRNMDMAWITVVAAPWTIASLLRRGRSPRGSPTAWRGAPARQPILTPKTRCKITTIVKNPKNALNSNSAA